MTGLSRTSSNHGAHDGKKLALVKWATDVAAMTASLSRVSGVLCLAVHRVFVSSLRVAQKQQRHGSAISTWRCHCLWRRPHALCVVRNTESLCPVKETAHVC